MDKFVCLLKFVMGMVGWLEGVCVNDADGSIFLKIELVGFGVDSISRSELTITLVNQCPF
jgi:hypothetical protein